MAGAPPHAGRASTQAAGEGGVEAEQGGDSESNLELCQLSSPGLPQTRALDSSWAEV